MKQNMLLPLWGGLYVLCAALGFIPEPSGAVRFSMMGLAALFFLPPATVLYRASKSGNLQPVILIRNLAVIWLIVTTAVLAANVLSLKSSEFTGDFLHALLVIVSSPMICSQFWIAPIFFWACLLFSANHIIKSTKTRT